MPAKRQAWGPGAEGLGGGRGAAAARGGRGGRGGRGFSAAVTVPPTTMSSSSRLGAQIQAAENSRQQQLQICDEILHQQTALKQRLSLLEAAASQSSTTSQVHESALKVLSMRKRPHDVVGETMPPEGPHPNPETNDSALASPPEAGVPVELSSLPASLSGYSRDDALLLRVGSMSLGEAAKLCSTFISRAQEMLPHVQCHGSASPKARDMLLMVRQFANFWLVYGGVHNTLVHKDWNLETGQEEAPPEGWFDRLAAVIPHEHGLMSLAVAASDHIWSDLDSRHEQYAASCTAIAKLIKEGAEEDTPSSLELEDGLEMYNRNAQAVLMRMNMTSSSFISSLVDRVQPHVFANLVCGCWPFILRGLPLMEGYMKLRFVDSPLSCSAPTAPVPAPPPMAQAVRDAIMDRQLGQQLPDDLAQANVEAVQLPAEPMTMTDAVATRKRTRPPEPPEPDPRQASAEPVKVELEEVDGQEGSRRLRGDVTDDDSSREGAHLLLGQDPAAGRAAAALLHVSATRIPESPGVGDDSGRETGDKTAERGGDASLEPLGYPHVIPTQVTEIMKVDVRTQDDVERAVAPASLAVASQIVRPAGKRGRSFHGMRQAASAACHADARVATPGQRGGSGSTSTSTTTRSLTSSEGAAAAPPAGTTPLPASALAAEPPSSTLLLQLHGSSAPGSRLSLPQHSLATGVQAMQLGSHTYAPLQLFGSLGMSMPVQDGADRGQRSIQCMGGGRADAETQVQGLLGSSVQALYPGAGSAGSAGDSGVSSMLLQPSSAQVHAALERLGLTPAHGVSTLLTTLDGSSVRLTHANGGDLAQGSAGVAVGAGWLDGAALSGLPSRSVLLPSGVSLASLVQSSGAGPLPWTTSAVSTHGGGQAVSWCSDGPGKGGKPAAGTGTGAGTVMSVPQDACLVRTSDNKNASCNHTASPSNPQAGNEESKVNSTTGLPPFTVAAFSTTLNGSSCAQISHLDTYGLVAPSGTNLQSLQAMLFRPAGGSIGQLPRGAVQCQQSTQQLQLRHLYVQQQQQQLGHIYIQQQQQQQQQPGKKRRDQLVQPNTFGRHLGGTSPVAAMIRSNGANL